MKIEYGTKEESNRTREAAFLKLSPHERFMQFLALSRRVRHFKTKATAPPSKATHFVISAKDE